MFYTYVIDPLFSVYLTSSLHALICFHVVFYFYYFLFLQKLDMTGMSGMANILVTLLHICNLNQKSKRRGNFCFI